MDKYKAEMKAVLARAMQNYSNAVGFNRSGWSRKDEELKENVRKITGTKKQDGQSIPSGKSRVTSFQTGA